MTGNEAPHGLGIRATGFWADAHSRFDFNPAETELLREAVRVIDELESLAADVRRDGTTVLTAGGQPRLHPALASLTAGRNTLAKLLALVGLPYEGSAVVPTPRQVSARKAAQARWAGHTKETGTRRRD